MTTFLLVHGGGHGGWCWKPVVRLLRKAGHEVYAPTLSGLADRAHLLSPQLGLDTHIADIAGLMEYEDLTEIVLVGHSYGGMVITGAADRAIERVARLVYLDAAIPQDGEALVDVSPGLLALAGATREVDGVELGLWPDAAAAAIYGLAGCPYEEWAMARLTPHPWKSLVDRLVLRDAERVRGLPRAIINCAGTLKKRPEALLHRWNDAQHVRQIDTGHDLMLSEPEKVAEMLIEAALG
ncbi:alpha/beta fold hydrolase [Novosphingobium sp. M1R2S20]|uniref:Alpha/beta fold hydrolase n=1 Tax=Novosphingobium rhizovicinum TaxID=3228928 RepID=A0ABV3RFM8_9SPHN